MGEVLRRPGALNMLWVGENVELRTWSSTAQTPQVSGELRMPNLAIRFHFPCHKEKNCLPHAAHGSSNCPETTNREHCVTDLVKIK